MSVNKWNKFIYFIVALIVHKAYNARLDFKGKTFQPYSAYNLSFSDLVASKIISVKRKTI